MNLTVSIPGQVSYGGSNFTASLSQSQACLVDGDLICALTSPYTNSQSGIGQWFYVVMMSLPPLMVYIRTSSIGPTMILLMFSIWAYGAFAPLMGGNVLLPAEGFWLAYTLLGISISVVLYRLMKKG